MLFYSLLIAMLLIILLVRWSLARKNNIPVALFAEALRNENSGHYEKAVAAYQQALEEVNRTGLRSNVGLKNSITEKLKVLHTALEYQKNFTHKQVGNV